MSDYLVLHHSISRRKYFFLITKPKTTPLALPILIFVLTNFTAFSASILVKPLVAAGIEMNVADAIYDFIGHPIFLIGGIMMLTTSGFALQKVNFLPSLDMNARLFAIVAVVFGVLGFASTFIPPVTKLYLSPLAWVLTFLFQALFVGWTEELLFRAGLQNVLNYSFPSKRIFHLRMGTFIAAVIFGVGHIGNVFFALPFISALEDAIFALAFGFVVGWYYDKTQDIAGAAWIHNATDGLSTLAAFFISML